MREIKFRAWDKEENRMSKVEMLDFNQWVVGDEFVFERNSFRNEETDRQILMQYTGQKDKNGKEEYHFDITRNRYGQIRYIDWYCGAWWLMFSDGRNDKPLYGSHSAQEVIGNIYENPELLGRRNNLVKSLEGAR